MLRARGPAGRAGRGGGRTGRERTTTRRRASSRALGCTGGAVLALGALGVAITGVVLALNTFVHSPASGTCTVALADGGVQRLDADQADNAALFAANAAHRDLPARAVTIAIATALQESKMRNIDYGDRDSVGLFQQRPSQGWGTVEQIMDPVYSTNAFYDVLVTVQGWESQEITDAAQRVQRSGFPLAYAQHEDRGRAFASALSGYSPASLSCHLDPVVEAPDGVGAPGSAGDGESTPTAVVEGTASAGPIAGATPPARLATIQQRLTRDFVDISATVVPAGVLQVDATSLPAGLDPAPARRGWAVAQWAVATASQTGARVVAVDGQVWVRDDGDDAAWLPLAEAGLPAALHDATASAAPGAVLIG
ncbi:hypothetical protein ACFSBG_01490 [Georgenia yuyongxinii]|uniref:hypothetical protein n=1 Tax=Georgenia yuyongxinii TaxID=2589797 RepID=UPI001E5EA524|nr:hypothetical protein [Georgenia yuyongxinii]